MSSILINLFPLSLLIPPLPPEKYKFVQKMLYDREYMIREMDEPLDIIWKNFLSDRWHNFRLSEILQLISILLLYVFVTILLQLAFIESFKSGSKSYLAPVVIFPTLEQLLHMLISYLLP